MPPDIFDTTDLLQKGLAATQLRLDTISNNIANVDTPGFKASHVEFEAYMKQALEQDKEGSAAGGGSLSVADRYKDALKVQPAVIRDDSTTMRMDGNNVDIDSEMVAMVKSSVYYNTLVKKLNGEISRLKLAIDGR